MIFSKFERTSRPVSFSGKPQTRSEDSLSAFRLLRHIGFRSVNIPPGREHVSDGPSQFHELDFCVSGNVSVQIWRSRQRAEVFSARKGDFIFIPAGTTYSLYCANDEPIRLVSATARDGVDVNALPIDPGDTPLLEAERFCPDRLQDPPFQPIDGTNEPGGACYDDGHVVLFFDKRPDDSQVGTIGRVFDKQVIAREFGVSETELPELTLSFSEPLVIRPISEMQ